MRIVRTPKFLKTIKYLKKLERLDVLPILHEYGQLGVRALSNATPVDTGVASQSWSYEIKGNRERYEIVWSNSDIAGRVPLVILLQYGHATKSGYWLSGRDFINPALKPVYDGLHRALVREVTL